MSALAERLSDGEIEHMPTCAVATFTWDEDDWDVVDASSRRSGRSTARAELGASRSDAPRGVTARSGLEPCADGSG